MPDKRTIVKNILGQPHREGDEFLFHCPYCNHHKRKLSVNFDRNVFKCWICDNKGHLRRVVRRFGAFLQLKEWDEIEGTPDVLKFSDLFSPEVEENKRTFHLPEEFKTLVTSWSDESNSAYQYLIDRGLTQVDINQWRIGYAANGFYGGRIIVPSFDENGDLNYFVGRSYTGHHRKYIAPRTDKNIIFNELYVDWDDDVILVEGVFDAFKSVNAVPILGSTISEDSRLLRKIVQNDTPIFVALDWDAEKKAKRLLRLLLQYGVELYKIDTKGIEDIGAISKEEFLERKKRASVINSDSYILYEMRNFQ